MEARRITWVGIATSDHEPMVRFLKDILGLHTLYEFGSGRKPRDTAQ
jgi:hypothetical protein